MLRPGPYKDRWLDSQLRPDDFCPRRHEYTREARRLPRGTRFCIHCRREDAVEQGQIARECRKAGKPIPPSNEI